MRLEWLKKRELYHWTSQTYWKNSLKLSVWLLWCNTPFPKLAVKGSSSRILIFFLILLILLPYTSTYQFLSHLIILKSESPLIPVCNHLFSNCLTCFGPQQPESCCLLCDDKIYLVKIIRCEIKKKILVLFSARDDLFAFFLNTWQLLLCYAYLLHCMLASFSTTTGCYCFAIF